MSIENTLPQVRGTPAPRPRRERRAHRRKPTLWEGRFDCDAGVFACVVLNISAGGAMLRIVAPVIKGARATLMIERFGTLAAEIVWQMPDAQKLGLRFTEPSDRVARILGGTV